MDSLVQISTDDRGVATITLNRPNKHNALSAAMISDLRAAADGLGRNEAVRAVVLASTGKSFCAGGDLDWMRQQLDADAETRVSAARRLADMLWALNTLPKPLVGRVHGNAFGGGVGLLAVCDTVVAAETARLGLTETRLGLIPATIGPYVIARMGEARARRVFMSSRVFDAAEGAALGLVARVVPEDALDAAVEDEVLPYLSCAPGAVAAAKALARRLGPPIGEAEIDTSVAALVRQWEGEEAAEGVAAFFEKRPPRWAPE